MIVFSTETNEDKQIYCESIQQTLISSPPAVLILHLKRFQMCSSTAEKITSDVSFPWTLDIAPYCSVQCQVSVNLNIHQPHHRQY